MFEKQWPNPRKLQVEYDFDDDKNPNATLYGDTSYKFEDVKLEWTKNYHEMETGDFEVSQENIIEDYECLQWSSLHKIAPRPTIFPFYDMVF